jgi:hypothetical protein
MMATPVTTMPAVATMPAAMSVTGEGRHRKSSAAATAATSVIFLSISFPPIFKPLTTSRSS